MMDLKPKIISRHTFFRVGLRCFVMVSVLLGACGCSDFFANKPTDIESRAILADLSQVKDNPYVNNPLPAIYRDGPKRITVHNGVKLFYFTQHLPVAELADGLGGKGLGFTVSQNPSTNQLIIHCADDAEADTVLEYLANVDVPPIQINIDCLILERFGDVTTDWETTLLIDNFLGENIVLGRDKFPGAAFPGASLREIERSTFGLDFGYWIDKGVTGHEVRLIVDMLESRGYLKVLMNPTLETLNGKTASVSIMDLAPIEKTITGRGVDADGETITTSYELIEYKPVRDTLTVTPYVYSDGYIGLKTSIVVGSKSKPEGITQESIITERSIEITENRIKPGSSLVIGGMRKSENRSVIRGVPFFQDLPLIGVFFSSKDFEEKATEIVYILTPTISSGGKENAEMLDFIRDKYRTPEYTPGLTEAITNPMGREVYTELIEEKALKAVTQRDRAEMEKIIAELQAQSERAKAESAQKQIEAIKVEIAITKAKAQQAKQETKVVRGQTASEKKKAQQVLAEKQRIDAEVKKSQQAAQQMQKELDAIKAKAAADAK
ncbi:MAG TPA: hypothetical protein ENH94_02645 [Phycisphaerales bacterium]|nr:hypothetical protein [Phycisphaerales bacterium]